MRRSFQYLYSHVYLVTNFCLTLIYRNILNDIELESPQTYEAMYNIQAQAAAASSSGTDAILISSILAFYQHVLNCVLSHSDYSDLPPLTCSNGPRDPIGACSEEEEENCYDYPKPPLPVAPARRTLSETIPSTSAFSRHSIDSELGAAASKIQHTSDFICFLVVMPKVWLLGCKSLKC